MSRYLCVPVAILVLQLLKKLLLQQRRHARRCILCFREFDQATTINTVQVPPLLLKQTTNTVAI